MTDLDQDIQIPQPGEVRVTLNHLSDTTLPMVRQLSQALAMSQAHIDALLETCTQLKEQNAALRAQRASAAADGNVKPDAWGAKIDMSPSRPGYVSPYAPREATVVNGASG